MGVPGFFGGYPLRQFMECAEKVYYNSKYRISTSMLNEILTNAVAVNEPPVHNGKRCKIYYMTQADVAPPTFIVFVNDKNLMHFSYLRYLENSIRNAVDFSGTPIKIILKSKMEKDT